MQSKGGVSNTKTRHGAHTGSCTERRRSVPLAEGSSARKGDRAFRRGGIQNKYAVRSEGMQVTMIKAARHTGNRMTMTTRSRCLRRLHRSPSPFSQPYFCRSRTCPWAAVVASTMVASASAHAPVTVPRMVQGARRIRGWRRMRLTFPAFARVETYRTPCSSANQTGV